MEMAIHVKFLSILMEEICVSKFFVYSQFHIATPKKTLHIIQILTFLQKPLRFIKRVGDFFSDLDYNGQVKIKFL